MPITNALVLDPWLEPLPLPGPFPISDPDSVVKSVTSSLDEDESVPRLPRILVLNSETFTLWGDHYRRLQDVIQGWEPRGQRIITLSECLLPSF